MRVLGLCLAIYAALVFLILCFFAGADHHPQEWL